MKDDKIIKSINGLLQISEEARTSGDDKKVVETLNEIFSIVHGLSSEIKTSIREVLYRNQVNLGIAYYRLDDRLNAIKSLENCKKLYAYYTDSLEGRYNVLHLISHCKLYLGVNHNMENYKNDAEKIINHEFDHLDKLSDSRLKQRISDDRDILEAYQKNTLRTIVILEFPTPIIIGDSQYCFEYENITCELLFNNIQTVENEQFVELQYDKYGLANTTRITLTMYRYFEHDIGNYDDHVNIRDYAIKVINFFVERFKIVTNRFWIENLNQYWLTGYSFEILAGDKTLRNCPMIDPRSYIVSSSLDSLLLPEKEEEYLKLLLNQTNISLWKSMLLISKDFLFVQKYREAVFALNCAFENLIETDIRTLLESHMGKEEANNYFIGSISYDSYPLKKYILQNKFDEAVKAGLIKNQIPSTYAILKNCNKYLNTGMSSSNLTKIINQIRANRNEVVHGREYDPMYGPIEESVPRSIEKFEELLRLFNII